MGLEIITFLEERNSRSQDAVPFFLELLGAL